MCVQSQASKWPKSGLGMSTGLCRVTGREIFCVMKVFYDGSEGTDATGDRWITLAGIAATDAVWAEFDERWSKMLHARYPKAPYIHMIELLDNHDPFETVVGWGYEEKRQLVQDAIVLLSQMNKEQFRMAWCSINESERLRFEEQGKDVPSDPYLHCTADCLFLTVGAYIHNVKNEAREPIYVFFDRGEKFLGNFKNNWLRGRTKPGQQIDPENGWDYYRDVQELDLPFHGGLQAADMVAWANSRVLSEQERPFSWLKEWLVKVVPSSGISYAGDRLCKPRDSRKGWERMFSRI